MVLTESIVINAPLVKVWETFTDLACWTDWNTVIRDVAYKDKRITSGNKIKCSFKPFFFLIKVDIKIEEVLPLERVTWSARKKGLSARHEIIFEKHDNAVKVTSRESFRGALTRAFGMLLPRLKMTALKKTFLQDLKKAAELSDKT